MKCFMKMAPTTLLCLAINRVSDIDIRYNYKDKVIVICKSTVICTPAERSFPI